MAPKISTGWIVVSIVLAIALAIASFVGTAFAEGAWQSIVSGLGSAFLSLALALLVTEVFLRPLFTTDVIQVAGLSRRVADLGFRDLKSESAVDFATFYRQGGDVWVLVQNPPTWTSRDLEHVLDSAEFKRAKYTIIFPQPGVVSRTVAASIGVDPTAFEASVTEAAATLEREWRARKIAGSSVVINYLEVVPRSFLATNGSTALLGVETPVYKSTHRSMVVEIDLGNNSDVESWIRKSKTAIDSLVENPAAWTSPPARKS